MRVLHSGTLDTSAGGPAMSTYLTLFGLRKLGVEVEMIMFPLSKGGHMYGTDVPTHITVAPRYRKYGYTRTLKHDIIALGDFDVYHSQGIWQYNTYVMTTVAIQFGKPYIITPRGMLYPQDISKSNKLLKYISLKLRLLGDMNSAACIHVTCNEEMQHCRNIGITSPIAVIPNPVEIKEYDIKQSKDDIFRIGYLGRISKRKNIHGLISAYARIANAAGKTELHIIGGGDSDYESQLYAMTQQIKNGKVVFHGFLNDKAKDQVLATLSVLVMPSEFENFGNVILEALVRRIPCIATKGSPWHELVTHKCGWWIDYNDDALAQALTWAINTPTVELQAMGERGRELVEQRYSVESIAANMKQLYDWVVGKGGKPDFIYEIAQNQ